MALLWTGQRVSPQDLAMMNTSGLNGTQTQLARVWGQDIAFGLSIWVAFLLALEPGNVARAIDAGGGLVWSEEIVRILGASLLGASSTPLVMALIRRFPIERPNLLRHISIQALGGASIALGLIVVSCVLAAWLKIGDSRPVLVALPNEIASNWLLLIFCIGAMSAIAHAVYFFRRHEIGRAFADAPATAQPEATTATTFITAVAVKSRGRQTLVGLSTVDWIETQGNYLALHVGPDVHLIRATAAAFEAKLNPMHFVRIHRRMLVAVDRVCRMGALANGDAAIELIDGTNLRASRNFREKVRAAIARRTEI